MKITETRHALLTRWTRLAVVSGLVACLTFCGVLAPRAQPGPGALVRVKVVTVQPSDVAPDIVITGDIQARYETKVSFRTGGKISERLVDVGARVAADEVLARLDGLEQIVSVRSAEAALRSAQAVHVQARQAFERQQKLIGAGHTTRVAYDGAEQAWTTTQSQVESMEAALATAKEQLAYTDLRAGVGGIVTAREAETGQVVQPGTTILTVAQDGPRDAVFHVHEALLASPPGNPRIEVVLQADKSIRTSATVREISPSTDPATGAVRLKATLESTPPEMALGAVIVGRGRAGSAPAIGLPWSALYRWDGQSAVWVVDPTNDTVSPQTVTIDRATSDRLVVSRGIREGDRIVTAGIQFLRPGQRVVVVPAEHRP